MEELWEGLTALSGIIVTMSLKDGWPMAAAIVMAMGAGALCGLANGSIHVYARIPSFIVTMGMLNIARGLVLVITNSYPVTGLPDSFKVIGRDMWGFCLCRLSLCSSAMYLDMLC